MAVMASQYMANGAQLHVLTLPDATARQARVREWLERSGLPEDVFVQGIDLRRETNAFEAPRAGRIHRQRRYGRDDLTPPGIRLSAGSSAHLGAGGRSIGGLGSGAGR